MKILLRLVCACAAFACGGCNAHWDSSVSDRYSSRFHQVVPAAAAHGVQITNLSGPVAISGWNKPTVEINAILHAPSVDAMSRLHVDVAQQGDRIRIATRYGEPGILANIGHPNEGSIDYVVHVPAQMAVRVENISGDVSVKSVRNDVAVHDVSGTVTTEGTVGSLDLGTTSGDIVASVSSVSPSQRFKLYSVSGDTTLRIPKRAPADLKANSISGDFSSNLPVRSEMRTVGSQVDQKINGGGAQIALNTVSGAIKLTGK